MSFVLAGLDLIHGDLPVVGIVGLSVLVRSTFGFGDALVAMPLLLLVIDDPVSVAALVAMVSLVTAATIFAMDHRRLSLSADAWVLSGAAVPGLLCSGLFSPCNSTHKALSAPARVFQSSGTFAGTMSSLTCRRDQCVGVRE